MKKCLYFFALLNFMNIISFRTSFSDPVNAFIQSVSPGMNSIGAEKSGNLIIVFTQNMDPSTINSESVKLTGSLTGKIDVSVSYNQIEKKAVIDPDIDFKTGEKVTVVLTKDIKTAANIRIIPFQYSFISRCEKGNGSMTRSNIIPPSWYYPRGSCINGDFDRDGDLDIIYPYYHNEYQYYSSGFITYKNSGNNNYNLFAIQQLYDMFSENQCAGIQSSDVNRDGFLDLIVLSDGLMSILGWSENNGQGGFGYTMLTLFDNMALANITDIDSDGDQDLAYIEYPHYILVLMINEGATFTKIQTQDSGLYSITTSGDFDNDGDEDYVINQWWSIINYLLLNQGDYTFLKTQIQFDSSYFLVSSISEDLNLDGNLDLIVSSYSESSIYLGSGNGTFSKGSNCYAPIIAGDFDSDNDLDFYTGQNRIYFNDGAGRFDFFETINSGNAASLAGDMNSDGSLDLIAFGEHGAMDLLQNEPSTTSLHLITGPEHLLPGKDSVLYRCSLEGGFWTLSNLDYTRAIFISPINDDSVYVNPGKNVGQFVLSYRSADTIFCSFNVNIDNLYIIEGPDHVLPGYDSILYNISFGGGFWTLSNFGNTQAVIISPPEKDSICVVAGNNYGHFILYYQNDEMVFCSKHIYIDNPLPAELSAFTSSVSGRNVTLNWSTSAELNNSGFDIERTSIENQWIKAGFIKGHGTISEPQNYSFTDKNLATGKYKYRLKQIDFNGNFEYFELAEEVSIGIPDKFELSQNYPNPFNPVTNLEFGIAKLEFVSIKIYDVIGRELITLVNEVKEPGYYKIQFNAGNLSSGVYFYRMEAGDFVTVKKFVVMK